jgi:hypothetical protein
MMPWVGSKEFAFILARLNAPEFGAAPGNFQALARRKIFYDPSPAGDRSLRAYIRKVSYGRARLVGDVFGPYNVPVARNPNGVDCGATMDNGIRAARGSIEGIPYACVIFPSGPCTPWAFWGFGPDAFYPGSTITGASYVHITDSLGAFAMENLHISTGFGDLYGIPDSPGGFDEMDCACGVHPSSFTKINLGWLDAATIPSVLGPTGTGSFTLHALASAAPSGRVSAVKIPSILSGGYFLAEARLRVDRFESPTTGVSSGIPSEGVVVYWIDETSWPPVHLRTAAALAAGSKFSDGTEGVEITVSGQVPSGFSIQVTRTEPADCQFISREIAALRDEIVALQGELRSAAPGEKPAIVAQIRAAQRKVIVLQQRAARLGCSLADLALEAIDPESPDLLLPAELRDVARDTPHEQATFASEEGESADTTSEAESA